ncbi:SMP-30/gluconolactonase/LRE family protein [Candidatus Solirubrobacter pratensis]|uniref:SMP-30/gluconolactonase/LRE family protein n=1 Tax=Candidatus Solirubrobacter pratensis TaxID=1298857 RepID=UPI0004243B62|nr:SMP-30/gluconolactonase/LRE family protein [Candidatus Solirubrobacter pratensis]
MIALERASIFFDGTTSEPRLSHPECLAFDAEGAAWCGGDRGELYRVAPDGSAIEQVATTGGFTLGVALDGEGALYSCDLAHRAVFRLDLASGEISRFAEGMRTPNFPVVDARRGCLWVSDSRDPAGPGIWRVDLETGAAELWHEGPLHFANGMALEPGGDALYVVETWAQRVVRIPIAGGAPEPVVEGIERVPDGIALDAGGLLYIACYEPSRVYRCDPATGALELLLDDPTAHVLCHPTNCAFRGTELFMANLGRWHLTRVDVGVEGASTR